MSAVRWTVRCPVCTGTRWRFIEHDCTGMCTACGKTVTEEWAEEHAVPAPPDPGQRTYARARVRGQCIEYY